MTFPSMSADSRDGSCHQAHWAPLCSLMNQGRAPGNEHIGHLGTSLRHGEASSGLLIASVQDYADLHARRGRSRANQEVPVRSASRAGPRTKSSVVRLKSSHRRRCPGRPSAGGASPSGGRRPLRRPGDGACARTAAACGPIRHIRDAGRQRRAAWLRQGHARPDAGQASGRRAAPERRPASAAGGIGQGLRHLHARSARADPT